MASDEVAVSAGLCSITLRQLTPEAIIAIAESAGLAGIEWGADVHVPPGDTDRAATIARQCADAGIRCPSYGTYIAAGKVTPREVEPALDTAAALGVTNVRIWTEYGVTPQTDRDRRSQVLEAVNLLASTITARGFTTSLEYHVDTLTHTAESTLAVLAAAAQPGLFSYWQPDWTLPLETLLREYRSVAPRVSHLHVFCWQSYRSRHPLATGEPLWRTVLNEARQPGAWGRERFAFLEHVKGDDPAQVAADAATLIGWLTEGNEDG